MDILGGYREALLSFRKKEYDAALEKILTVREAVCRWPRADLLLAYVYRERRQYLSEIRALQDCLGSVDASNLEERKIAADAWSLLGAAYHMLGNARRAVEAFRQSSRWEPSLAKKRMESSNALFAANSVSDCSIEEYQRLYREYRLLVEDIVPYPLCFYHHDRLRVGYLSSDFREHPLACFLWTLLRKHDRDAFCLYCYAGNQGDGMTEKMRAEVEVWREVSNNSDEEIAKLVRQDEIDILFDLSGHTSDNHLAVMACHPATVQISGLGAVNSTGMDCIEYFWADRNCCGHPGNVRDYFVETVLHDLRSMICYTPFREMPEPTAPPCAKNSYITFGCFNNFSKVTDEILSVWARILREVPQSRLVLKHRLFDSEEGIGYTLERFRRLGLDDSRVEFRGFSRDYLKDYADIDVALDTYPYVGFVTTCEALYMGVPVVSLFGKRLGTRFGYGVLKTLGLEEMAAGSYEDYIGKAVALAEDRKLIGWLHRDLRGRMQQSALMDADAYIKDVEELYQRLWIKAYAARGGFR